MSEHPENPAALLQPNLQLNSHQTAPGTTGSSNLIPNNGGTSEAHSTALVPVNPVANGTLLPPPMAGNRPTSIPPKIEEGTTGSRYHDNNQILYIRPDGRVSLSLVVDANKAGTKRAAAAAVDPSSSSSMLTPDVAVEDAMNKMEAAPNKRRRTVSPDRLFVVPNP
eukprot:scaffold7520_cov114-Cylindrotheca_fusiformis.AAC.1